MHAITEMALTGSVSLVCDWSGSAGCGRSVVVFEKAFYQASVLNQKFAASNWGRDIVAAEALDRGENIVC